MMQVKHLTSKLDIIKKNCTKIPKSAHEIAITSKMEKGKKKECTTHPNNVVGIQFLRVKEESDKARIILSSWITYSKY